MARGTGPKSGADRGQARRTEAQALRRSTKLEVQRDESNKSISQPESQLASEAESMGTGRYHHNDRMKM